MAEEPVRTAETEIIVDEQTGETIREIEHFRQGDTYYRIVHERSKVEEESSEQVKFRTFSKLYLYVALAKAGLWEPFKTWLSTQTTEDGINALEAFEKASVLSEGHPLFEQWFSQVKEVLGIGDLEAEQILQYSVVETDI